MTHHPCHSGSPLRFPYGSKAVCRGDCPRACVLAPSLALTRPRERAGKALNFELPAFGETSVTRPNAGPPAKTTPCAKEPRLRPWTGKPFETRVLVLSLRKIAPNAGKTGSERQGRVKAPSRHPLVRGVVLGSGPCVGPRGSGIATREGSVPSASHHRSSSLCSLCLSVRGWFVCSLLIFCPNPRSTTSDVASYPLLPTMTSAMLMFRLLGWPRCQLRSFASRPDVDAMAPLDLLAQAQTLCDEVALAQLALELEQARLTEELDTELQVKKQAAAQAVTAERKERARLRREVAAQKVQRKAAGDATSTAPKKARQRECMMKLRIKQREAADDTEYKQRLANDRQAQRVSAKVWKTAARQV